MDRDIEQLKKKAKTIRYDIVRMIGPNRAGHLGGSCSIADIMTVLYFYKMHIDPSNPQMPDRDRFVLSKGHATLAWYAALAERGYFPKAWLDTLKNLGSHLQGHPDMTKLAGIEANTGSLGQGLSIACGMAAAAKLDRNPCKIYCIIGDGELAEGEIWEAALAAKVYGLDNLVVFLDKNNLQATGPVAERFNTNPVAEKWKAFGWNVRECDGHDIPSIIDALDEGNVEEEMPNLIIAHTVKGKGVSFAENVAAFHNGAMTESQYYQALDELKQGGESFGEQ